MIKKFFILLGLALLAILGLYKSPNGYLIPGYHHFFYTKEGYKKLITDIEEEKVDLQKDYAAEKSKKAKWIQKSRDKLLQNADAIFNYWYGTKWDLNGTSQTPGEGKIACGYFVSTVLRDAGFPIQRVKMGQLASEEAIRNLVHKKAIQRFYKINLPIFVQAIKKEGEGLFLVGLDTHIGFALYQDGEVWFIHSTSTKPYCVIREKAADSPTLRHSKYKVFGKLSDDERFLLTWLETASK